MKQMSNPSLVEEMDIFKTNGDDDDDDRLRSSNKLSFHGSHFNCNSYLP